MRNDPVKIDSLRGVVGLFGSALRVGYIVTMTKHISYVLTSF